MAVDRAFHDHVVHDLLADVTGISSRSMFGGWGIYRDGIFFAIITDGELYFKVDGTNRPAFERRNSRPFVYERDGKPITMSYWLVPEEILEDRDELVAWAEASVAVGRRAKG